MDLKKYFAYGSNMPSQEFSKRCPNAKCLGPARLADYQLAFTRRSVRRNSGVADIIYTSGETTWGVLYEINDEEIKQLDKKEGVESGAYKHIVVTVTLKDSTSHEAFSYEVVDKAPNTIPPKKSYKNLLVEGAREQGLPEDYITFLECIETED